MAKVRLDALLAQRGLFETRSRAAAAVMAGEVLLGPGRERAAKAGQLVHDDVLVDVVQREAFVSRGGRKLANALDALGVPVAGRRCLDVGASTGGFTDCLLQRGAEHVIALDVAYGELHWSLRTDDRVTVLERSNARALQPADLPFRPSLAVADVSFISLTKVLPAVIGSLDPAGFDLLAMVKPQFEAGREHVARGGVVRDPAARRAAVLAVAASARGAGAQVLGLASSGLPGPKGNRETFLWLGDDGRPDGLDHDELEARARASDPDDDAAPG